MKIRRYLQDPAHCATAATASICNYYNSKIDYEQTKKVAQFFLGPLNGGLVDGEMGILFNLLGFRVVDIITTDLYLFDYSWATFGRRKLIATMEKAKNKISEEYREDFKHLIKFLRNRGFKNNIIIDYNFGKHIRKCLDKHILVLLGFNWTMFFKMPKENCWGAKSPARGYWQYHAIVGYRYDEKGVYVCDSHQEAYKYRLKRFRTGRYKISWENLATVLEGGSIIIPKDYDIEIYNKTIKGMG